ncbi:MAG TPA: DUF3943 domain-containing protein [Burkholderiaceae bacterium]
MNAGTGRAARLVRHACLAAASLALLNPVAPAHGQTTQDSPAPTEPDHSDLVPAAEIIGFDFLLNRFNRRFSGSSDYDVSWGSIRRNLRGPWIVDNDPFKINQFAHPYQGSIYHDAARSAGLGYWQASAYTFVGSAWWEITGEQTPPARNDQVASGIAGSFLGEPLFRMARLVLENRSELPYVWREWAAAAISPSYGFNRLLYGNRFEDSFSDHDPIYYSRLRLGARRAVGQASLDTGGDKRQDAEVDFAMDYGLPGDEHYSYHRPFDFFSFRAVASSTGGMEVLSSRGLLVGTDFAAGDAYRGLWGLYANYDYIAPSLFHVSSTGLSIGTTGQWWATQNLALQGTALVGVGYSAASTSSASQNDRDYHYGMAPRLGLSLRAIAGSRASLDLDAQEYFIGRIANRSAGRDDVSRVDAALTWRVHGRHAIGLRYVVSRRSASFQGGNAAASLRLATVGVFYTLLGLDDFGTVDWRHGASARE